MGEKDERCTHTRHCLASLQHSRHLDGTACLTQATSGLGGSECQLASEAESSSLFSSPGCLTYHKVTSTKAPQRQPCLATTSKHPLSRQRETQPRVSKCARLMQCSSQPSRNTALLGGRLPSSDVFFMTEDAIVSFLDSCLAFPLITPSAMDVLWKHASARSLRLDQLGSGKCCL